MPEITWEDAVALFKQWATTRPEGATWPRIQENPYGDNTMGQAYDEGWWACMRRFHKEGRSFTP